MVEFAPFQKISKKKLKKKDAKAGSIEEGMCVLELFLLQTMNLLKWIIKQTHFCLQPRPRIQAFFGDLLLR